MKKQCKSCKKEIDAKATKCPYCQTDQRGWFRRHPILTVIIVLILLGIFGSSLGDKNKDIASSETNSNSPAPAKTEDKAVLTKTPAPTQVKQTDNPKVSSTSSETVSQRNAVKKAKSYLSYTAFSHDGLVAQLEYEQFSHADAVYGADNSGANWNEQATKKAKSYMDYSAFSRSSLIEQLKYDKFTQEQAEYGVNAVGL